MNIITLTTGSGSIYQIDEANKKVRRVYGTIDPTERQGKDDDWKEYKDIALSDQNKLIIIWDYVDGVAKSTMTSIIIKRSNSCSNLKE